MLSKFSVKKPYTVVVAVILVLILGFISFTGMSTDLLPSVSLPYVMVMTSYQGATPEEVELMVTKPVEQSMATVSNIKTVASESSENVSIVLLEFYQSTNMDSVTLEMRENLDLVSSMWQDENIGSPMIMKLDPNMMPVMVASVDMKGKNAAELSTFVDEQIMSRFERIEGVASVSAMGLSEENLKVTIDEDRIALVNDAIAASIDGDINKARSALAQARSQINAASGQLEAELNKSAAAIKEGETQIAQGKQQIDAAEGELNNTIAGLDEQKDALTAQKNSLTSQKAGVVKEIESIESQGGTVPQSLLDQKAQIDAALDEVNQGLNKVNTGLKEANAGKDQIASQKKELNDKDAELQAGKAALESEGNKAKSQIAQGKSEIAAQSKLLESQAKSAKDEASIDDMITVEMISGILAAQNFSMPAGSLGEKSDHYTVKVGDTFGDVEEVKNILLFELDMDGVDDVRLNDVADVSLSNSSDEMYTKVNGNDGILLAFQKQSTYSTADVSEKINAEMATLETEYEGLSLTSFMDQGIYINMVTDSVLNNLIAGGILAIFILFLFLRDMRPTLVVAISIPASVLFAIVMMYFTGVTLNIISLSGLALGIGMLVDNSIVVIENIYRLRREGVPPKEAAIQGAKQVSGAIIASTLTTICVFFPIVFTDGISKELFMDMGLTIAFSLIASLLVALSLVPSMSARVLKKEYKGEGKFFLKLKKGYGKILTWTLRHRVLVMILVTVMLFASAAIAVSKGTSFIPESDSTEMTATITVDKEATQEELWQNADAFMETAMAIPEVKSVGAMDQSSSGPGGMSMGGGTSSSIMFYMILNEDKERTNKQISAELKKETQDLDCEVAISASSMDMSMLGGSGIQLTVKGDDLDTLSDITMDLKELMEGIEGVEEVTHSMDTATPEIMITVDKDKAMKEGFTVAQVYATVSAAIEQGKKATTLTMEGKDYPVIVVDRKAEDMTIEEMEEIPLVSQESAAPQGPTGGTAKEKEDEEDEELTVGDVAEISQKQSPATISRMSQERYMTATAVVKDGYNVGLVSADVKEALAKYDVAKGYSVEIAGESVTIDKAVTDLMKVILLAFLLTYLIMVAQFQSLRAPFIVMFTIPLAFTGGFLALIITGMDVSVIALLGFLVLTGVVVNNGIVLVDYINQLREKGMDKKSAILLGGETRLRPILMTALTTVLGLTTMAMGVGMGAEMVQPMAIVCIGGLLYATFLTLFVVPIMYDFSHPTKKKKKKKKKKNEEFEDGVLFDVEEDGGGEK